MYKIIAKILTNRLKLVVDFLVGPSQSAFIEGRNILDNVIMGHELIKGYTQKAVSPRCMIKVDIRKAYDSVEWGFLKAVLLEFGVPYKLVTLIMEADEVSMKMLMEVFDQFSKAASLQVNLKKKLTVHSTCSQGIQRKNASRASPSRRQLSIQIFGSTSVHKENYYSTMHAISGEDSGHNQKLDIQVFILCWKTTNHQENYLWTGSHDTSHRAPIAWETLCKPETAGGLNIIDYDRWNKTALTKLLWAIMSKKDKLWIKWIHCHYIKKKDITTMEIPRQASWLVRKLFAARE
ncbi:uncharacterized protein LOC142168374 [Nicotiana tabacum]|uniref:Uncharacterized protein LOC142168374 n=1 Tax=Nicotiana tabacum TaxID=4097 RepID=A0AC58SJL5_TOBAC